MKYNKKYFKASQLVFWSIVLTSFTGIFGAAPMYVLRGTLGRPIYWLLLTGTSLLIWGLGLKFFAMSFMSFSVLVGIYREFEIRGKSQFTAGFLSVAVTALPLISLFLFWEKEQGQVWAMTVKQELMQAFEKKAWIKTPSGSTELVESLFTQGPSFIVIALCLALFMTLLFERRIAFWLDLELYVPNVIPREKLTDFFTPDSLIWLLMVALLGSFLKLEPAWIKVVSTNILNVCIVLYFFQGLAVVYKFFEEFKVRVFWRWIFTIIMVLQLFIFVSTLGLVDYWINFRARIVKKATQEKKKSW